MKGIPLRYLSPLLSDARGPLGATVYAKNPYGLYTRARTIPAQPRTPAQLAGRAIFAAASTAWRTQLPGTLALWRTAALAYIRHDSLGRPYHPSGFTLFVGCWRNVLQVGGTAPPLPPDPSQPALKIDWTVADFGFNTGLFKAKLYSPPAFWSSYNAQYVVAATPALPLSVNFIPSQFYRILDRAFFIELGQVLDLTDAYTHTFGQPAYSTRVGLRVVWKNRYTGIAGPQTIAWAETQA